MTDPGDIPLTTVLQHMHGMEQRLGERIDGVEQRLDKRIDGVEQQLVELKTTVERHHAQTTVSLDNIDARLDDLEVVQVPTIKKAVGIQ